MRRVAQVVNLRFVLTVIVVPQIINLRYTKSLAAPEGHDHQARHVNRGQQRGDGPDKPKSLRGSGGNAG